MTRQLCAGSRRWWPAGPTRRRCSWPSRKKPGVSWARASNLARFADDDQALTVGEWREGEAPAVPLGELGSMDGPTVGGLIRRTGRPARVDDATDLPGRSAESLRARGMLSGVGAPVYVGGELWGALMLSSNRVGAFPPDAEQRVAQFAELAGLAVAEADARQRLEQLVEEQAALRRVATLVAVEHDADTLFAAVTEEAARVMGALQANLTRFEGEDGAFVLGAWTGPGGVAGVGKGERLTLDGRTVSGLVRTTGRPARVDDYTHVEGPLVQRLKDLGIRSAAGAPIRVGGELWGVLTVQSERPHNFPPGAENRVEAFTELLAAALSEAETREQLKRVADEQAALRRVATLVATEREPGVVFQAVSEEAGRLLDARQASVSRFEAPEVVRVLGDYSQGAPLGLGLGSRIELDGATAAGLVCRTGEPARVDDYAETSGPLVTRLREIGIASGIAVPIRVGGEMWGVLTLQSDRPCSFGPEAEGRIQDFAELVAASLANADARERLAASRARIVEASDEARRRIERDLHDGAQQRLVSLALDLRGAEAAVERAPATAAERLVEAREKLDEALAELRELARGIHPALLTDRGLAAALEGLAHRSPVPVAAQVSLAERLPPSLEAAAYFVVSEALANVAKYAEAGSVDVRVWHDNGAAHVAVSDDGRGGADPERGSGLRGLRDRVEALGGTLDLQSPPGGGTTVSASLPAR